jgi:hypothetical protein
MTLFKSSISIALSGIIVFRHSIVCLNVYCQLCFSPFRHTPSAPSNPIHWKDQAGSQDNGLLSIPITLNTPS